MELFTQVVAVLGLVFGLCGFLAGAAAIITVIGWSRSTHKIEYRPVEETRFERDLPPGVADFLPSPPEELTPQEYAKRLLDQQEVSYDE